MSAESNRIAVLTGISGEELIETELSTYGDIAATSDEEMQALERSGKLTGKQQRKVKAIRDYLLESNVIKEDTTMEGILAWAYNKKPPPSISLEQNLMKRLERLDEVFEYIEEKQREEATIVLSKIKTRSYNAVQSLLQLKIKGAVWQTRPKDLLSPPRFRWNSGLREEHIENRRLYMSHLNEHYTWPAGHLLADCNEAGHGYANLLNTRNFDGEHSTSGNIDVVAAEEDDVKNHAIKQNIKAGIELKKADNPGNHQRQVVLQHLSASSLNPRFGILTLMTDLNTRWHFYWFASTGRTIYTLETSGAEAVFLLKHIFDDPDTADSSLCFPVDFLNRGTWNSFISPVLETIEENPSSERGGIGEGGGGGGSGGGGSEPQYSEKTDNKESESDSRQSRDMQQPRHEHGGDIANLLDNLDCLDEDERREVILGYVADVVVPLMVL